MDELVAELQLVGDRQTLHARDGAPHLGELLLARLGLGELLRLLRARQQQLAEAIEDLILLTLREAARDPPPRDPPRELARLALGMREVLVEDAPHDTRAPRIERSAGARAEQEAGEVEPALLVIGGLLAVGGDLDERVEQRAGRLHRPLVATGFEQRLEVARQRLQAGAGRERGL